MTAIRVYYNDPTTEQSMYVVTDKVEIVTSGDTLRVKCKQLVTGKQFDLPYNGTWFEEFTLRIGGEW